MSWTPKPGKSTEFLADFAPVEIPPELDGATAELLADLYDQTTKFGIEVEGDGGGKVRRTYFDSPSMTVSVPASASLKSAAFIMCVFGEGTVMAHGAFVIKLRCGARVVWDKRVGIDDAERFIVAIDTTVEKLFGGAITESGERVDMGFRYPPQRSKECLN